MEIGHHFTLLTIQTKTVYLEFLYILFYESLSNSSMSIFCAAFIEGEQRPHGVTNQKNTNDIFSAEGVSNLTLR